MAVTPRGCCLERRAGIAPEPPVERDDFCVIRGRNAAHNVRVARHYYPKEAVQGMNQKTNNSVEPTGGSRFGHRGFLSHRRLPPVAHAGRSALLKRTWRRFAPASQRTR